MKTFFLSITVLLAVVNLGLGIKCYFGDKDDVEQDNLQDKLLIVTLQTCTKTTTTLGGSESVLRAGLPTTHDNGCSTMGNITTCYCNTDACNAATSKTLLLPVLVLPALITRFL